MGDMYRKKFIKISNRVYVNIDQISTMTITESNLTLASETNPDLYCVVIRMTNDSLYYTNEMDLDACHQFIDDHI